MGVTERTWKGIDKGGRGTRYHMKCRSTDLCTGNLPHILWFVDYLLLFFTSSLEVLVPRLSWSQGPGTKSPGTYDLLFWDFPGRPGTFL